MNQRDQLTAFDTQVRAEAERVIALGRSQLLGSAIATMVYDFRAEQNRDIYIAGAYAGLKIWRDIEHE